MFIDINILYCCGKKFIVSSLKFSFIENKWLS
jgi:hypothetical protein